MRGWYAEKDLIQIWGPRADLAMKMNQQVEKRRQDTDVATLEKRALRTLAFRQQQRFT